MCIEKIKRHWEHLCKYWNLYILEEIKSENSFWISTQILKVHSGGDWVTQTLFEKAHKVLKVHSESDRVQQKTCWKSTQIALSTFEEH